MPKTQYTFGSIIPLIGGMTIAAEQVTGNSPEFIASWGSSFGFNDSFCLKYYETRNIPITYYELDDADLPRHYVDIITSLPPCAGLSTANTSRTGKNPHGCNAPSNEHMIHGCEQAMKFSEPRCIIVENAPKLFTPYGVPFAQRIANLANSYGYTMSMIKTSTIHHGIPQDRPRSFYFLWKGSQAPILKQIKKPYPEFHEFMSTREFTKSEVASNRKAPPSSDPYWRFIQYKNPGLSKQDILKKYASSASISVWMVIRKNDWINEAIEYMEANGHSKQETWLKYARGKLSRGLGVMDASVKLTWLRSRSLMWQSAPHTMHPYEDRWLTTSETLALMGFPDDFNSIVPITTKDSNIIYQNCPVCTAADWISQIVDAFDGKLEWVDVPAGQILRQSNILKKGAMRPVIS